MKWQPTKIFVLCWRACISITYPNSALPGNWYSRCRGGDIRPESVIADNIDRGREQIRTHHIITAVTLLNVLGKRCTS